MARAILANEVGSGDTRIDGYPVVFFCMETPMIKRIKSDASAWFCPLFLLVSITLSSAGGAYAKEGPFSAGWTLDETSSSLTFQSIKNGSKVETSRFASYQGNIDEQGLATIRIQLDSVDTMIDLRNVRMRFLFFETFKFPEATIAAKIDPATMSDLAAQRRLQIPLEFELDLHGIRQSLQVETVATMFADNQISIASVSPLSIETSLFDLDEGVRKLEEAAKVTIVPSGSVSFNFIFRANSDDTITETSAPTQPATTAIETVGEFTEEECAGRFEILSRTGALYFRSGRADLDPDSRPLLATVIDIVNRCPTLRIVVAGHTDSTGANGTNQRLSEARADSVLRYLVENGVEAGRVHSVGYGEARPVAPNDTARNRGRNRRIEFAVATN